MERFTRLIRFLDSISGITGSSGIAIASVPIYYSIIIANEEWSGEIFISDWTNFMDLVRGYFKLDMEANN
jgi:hypothetical protein